MDEHISLSFSVSPPPLFLLPSTFPPLLTRCRNSHCPIPTLKKKTLRINPMTSWSFGLVGPVCLLAVVLFHLSFKKIDHSSKVFLLCGVARQSYFLWEPTDAEVDQFFPSLFLRSLCHNPINLLRPHNSSLRPAPSKDEERCQRRHRQSLRLPPSPTLLWKKKRLCN